MSRYHVGTPQQLAQVKLAIDQGAGFHDGAGRPIPRTLEIMQNGVIVGTVQSDVWEAARGLQPRTCHPTDGSSVVLGDDGTAALLLLDTPYVEAQLGRTVRGIAIPSAAALVQVTRARDHGLLPAGVRDKLDDAYVDSQLAAADTPQARAAITAELQGRAAAALNRRDTRGAQAAIEKAMGLGRSP